MTTNQDILDDEIGTPPPSRIDVDKIILRQRQRVRLRQAGVGVAAAVMVVAFGAAIAMAPQAARQGTTGAGAAVSPSAPTPNRRAAEAARLTGVLELQLAKLLPNATFLPDPLVQTRTGASVALNPDAPLTFSDQRKYFLAAARIQEAAGLSGITVSVGHTDDTSASDLACDQAPQDSVGFECDVKTGPDGGAMLVLSNGYGNVRLITVDYIRPDGNHVYVQVVNGAALDPDGSGPPVTNPRPSPALTQAQVVALASISDLATTVG